jgi:nucleotide-binding universal stress UspA family protein
MTGRILIGIDGSAAADRALAWALDEAQRRGAGVHLLSAYTLPIVVGGVMGGYVGPAMTSEEIVQLRDANQALLDSRAAYATTSHPTVTVTSEVTQGAPAPALLERAESSALIVLGGEGTGAFEALVLGSVSHTLAHRSPVPVVLVPTTSSAGGPERVIVGTDGSAHSDAAIDFAAHEAALAQVELVIVHAWSYPYRRRDAESAATDEIGSMMQAEADAILASATSRAHESEPSLGTVTTRLVEGGAVDVLLATAGSADLLVVGARGRGSIRSILLGSTSSSLIHHSQGPVAIIH